LDPIQNLLDLAEEQFDPKETKTVISIKQQSKREGQSHIENEVIMKNIRTSVRPMKVTGRWLELAVKETIHNA
jgi:hypothetical protein